MGYHLGKRRRYAQINEAYKSFIDTLDPDIAANISKEWLIEKLKDKLVAEYDFQKRPGTMTIYRAFKLNPEIRREIALWKLEKSLKNT